MILARGFRQRTYMLQALVNRVLKENLTHSCLQFLNISFSHWIFNKKLHTHAHTHTHIRDYRALQHEVSHKYFNP